MVVGSSTLQRPDGTALLGNVIKMANTVAQPQDKEWRVLNVLQRVGRL